jgi:hypothetical protein
MDTAGDMGSLPPGDLQVRGPKNRTPRLVGETFDIPSVRERDLLNDRQAQAGAFLVGRKIWFEDLGPILG